MSRDAGNKRCCRCHTILTSEDKYHHGISCWKCEEDLFYAEKFDYFPLICAWRYAGYQVRWLQCVTGHHMSLLLRGICRCVVTCQSGLKHHRRGR